MIEGLLPLLLVLPIAGFVITAFFGRRFGKQAHWIPVGAIFRNAKTPLVDEYDHMRR